MEKEKRSQIIQMGVAFVILLGGILLPYEKIMECSPQNIENARLVTFLVAYCIVGNEVIKNAIASIREKQWMRPEVVLTVVSVAAFFMNAYADAVAVMLIFRLGTLLAGGYQTKENLRSKKELLRLWTIYFAVIILLSVVAALLESILLDGQILKWIYRSFAMILAANSGVLEYLLGKNLLKVRMQAERKHLKFKSDHQIEEYANAKTAVFWMEDCITTGTIEVDDVQIAKGNFMQKKQLLKMVDYAEKMVGYEIANTATGTGIRIQINQDLVYIGKKEFLQKHGISVQENKSPGIVVYIGTEKMYLGSLVYRDEIREKAIEKVEALKNAGIERLILLSKNTEAVTKMVAEKIGVDEYAAGLDEKKEKEFLKSLKRNAQGVLLFGKTDLLKRAQMITLSKETLGQMKKQIQSVLVIKTLLVLLALFGVFPMWIVMAVDMLGYRLAQAYPKHYKKKN